MNAFALLGFNPRPWLEPKTIQEQAGARSNPGKASREVIERVNEARKILADSCLRLQHLFELTYPDKEAGGEPASLPRVLVGWFEAAARLEERMCAFLTRKSAATSPLTRALLAREAMPLHEEAEEWLGRLATHEAEWLTALREWDARWQEGDPTARSCEVLAMFARAFSYLGRWRETVRNRAFVLLEP